ncbi:MAG: nucleotidyltransferase domain-containing protein [Candidatus Aenigmarchaeota archaeon]|nr:nucleotidyltransferase domain-containing protein [Candidatus Aenigmarchaeota archaeon]
MSFDRLEQELEDVELAKKQAQQKPHPALADQKEVIEKVVNYTNAIRKQYGELIKSVLIFGSVVKGTTVKGSDVDVWIIVDDTATKASDDLNRVIDHLYLIASETKDLHIQVHTLTEFWQSIRIGSPEFSNFLRYGLTIYDTGFMKPIQRMLQMGLIPPSDETVSLKTRAASTRYKKIKLDIKAMVFELRYTALDIVQAVVMYHYKETPDYKKAPEFLERMVKEKKLEPEYVDKFIELDKLWKDIDHGDIKEVATQHLEHALQLAKAIIDRMKKLLPRDFVGEESM